MKWLELVLWGISLRRTSIHSLMGMSYCPLGYIVEQDADISPWFSKVNFTSTVGSDMNRWRSVAAFAGATDNRSVDCPLDCAAASRPFSFENRLTLFTLLCGSFGSWDSFSKWPWARRCWFNIVFCMKRSPQMPHWYGRSPVCRRICSVRSFDWVNARSQYVHWCGFSPVWVLKLNITSQNRISNPKNVNASSCLPHMSSQFIWTRESTAANRAHAWAFASVCAPMAQHVRISWKSYRKKNEWSKRYGVAMTNISAYFYRRDRSWTVVPLCDVVCVQLDSMIPWNFSHNKCTNSRPWFRYGSNWDNGSACDS